MMIVMVPRAVAPQYWHRPWSEVLAAAERGDDGLCLHAPLWTPAREKPPIPEQYRLKDGSLDEARYAAAAMWYPREQQQAFLRGGDDAWTKDKTWLFQQNW